MQIVGVIGSASRSSNTARLVAKALEGAEVSGAQVDEIFLPECELHYCHGCMKCLSKGGCVIGDDLEALRTMLLGADGIILGSPTHALAPSAIMKNFLDRIGLFFVYTSALGGKYFAGIATAGAVGAKATAKKLASQAYGVFERGYVSGTLAVSLGHVAIEQFPQYLEEAFILGQKMTQDIRDRKTYSLQNLFGRMLNRLIVSKSFTKNIINNKDDRMKAVYEYHVQKGWLK